MCEQSLAYCAREFGIGELLLLGKGENSTGGRDRDSILSDAVEAIIGGILLLNNNITPDLDEFLYAI